MSAFLDLPAPSGSLSTNLIAIVVPILMRLRESQESTKFVDRLAYLGALGCGRESEPAPLDLAQASNQENDQRSMQGSKISRDLVLPASKILASALYAIHSGISDPDQIIESAARYGIERDSDAHPDRHRPALNRDGHRDL